MWGGARAFTRARCVGLSRPRGREDSRASRYCGLDQRVTPLLGGRARPRRYPRVAHRVARRAKLSDPRVAVSPNPATRCRRTAQCSQLWAATAFEARWPACRPPACDVMWRQPSSGRPPAMSSYPISGSPAVLRLATSCGTPLTAVRLEFALARLFSSRQGISASRLGLESISPARPR